MKKNQKKALAVGAGLAAIAATATGVYMLTGKNAKNRKKVAKWVGDVQKDVVDQLNKADKVTRRAYYDVVDSTIQNYKGLKNISASELAQTAAELKASWDLISRGVSAASSTVRRAVPKSVRTVSKAAKKASPKKVVRAVTKKAAPKKKAAAKKRRR
jgi:hypothetical protein